MSRVVVVVPTYDEAQNIPDLIAAIASSLARVDYTLLIVDDNSPDNTASIAESRGGERVVVHRRSGKGGIGSALQEGLRLALEFRDCRYVVTMDADLSHDPQDLQRLIEACENVDIVQASRYIRGGRIVGWNLFRKIISRGANLLCQIVGGSSTHESTTNYRVYSRHAAETVVRLCSEPGYEWVVEALLVAQQRGLSVLEIPVTFTDRVRGESKLGWRDLQRWWRFLWTTGLTRLELPAPLRYFPASLGIAVLGVGVNLGVLWFLKGRGFSLLVGGAVAIESSLLATFLGYDFWTSRGRRVSPTPSLRRLTRHHATSALAMGLNLASLWAFTSAAQVHYLVADGLGIGIAAMWNLIGSVRWVWRSAHPSAGTPPGTS